MASMLWGGWMFNDEAVGLMGCFQRQHGVFIFTLSTLTWALECFAWCVRAAGLSVKTNFCFTAEEMKSEIRKLLCGVPQGCVHRPLSCVYVSIISMFTYFKSVSSSTRCLCLNMQDHVTGWKRKSFIRSAWSNELQEKLPKIRVRVIVCGFPQTPHSTVLGAFNGS